MALGAAVRCYCRTAAYAEANKHLTLESSCGREQQREGAGLDLAKSVEGCGTMRRPKKRKKKNSSEPDHGTEGAAGQETSNVGL